jgi:hypothetical protein
MVLGALAYVGFATAMIANRWWQKDTSVRSDPQLELQEQSIPAQGFFSAVQPAFAAAAFAGRTLKKFSSPAAAPRGLSPQRHSRTKC